MQDDGKYVEIQVLFLEHWNMIYIRYNDNTLTDTVESENSILTNVYNYGGYSGMGLVDSYDEAGGQWTSLSLRPETISSALFIPQLLMECRSVNCISTDTDIVVFLSQQQATGKNGIQAKLRSISAGIQRTAVYCGNVDDVYINFDYIQISKSA